MGADTNPQITLIQLTMTFPLQSRCRSPWQTAGRQGSLILCSFSVVHMRHLMFLINTNRISLFVFLFPLEQCGYRVQNRTQRKQTTTCVEMLRVVFVSVLLTMSRSSTIMIRCQDFSALGQLGFSPRLMLVFMTLATSCKISEAFCHRVLS